MIDHGLEDIKEDEENLLLYCDFQDYGNLSKALEEQGIEVAEAKLDRIPSHYKQLSEEEVEEVIKLIEKMEDDEDVQQVFHNMDMSE